MDDDKNQENMFENIDRSHLNINRMSDKPDLDKVCSQSDEEEKPSEESTGKSMGFLDHLEELRKRLIKSVFATIIMTMVALYFSDYIMKFIQIPLEDKIKLYNISVTGSFYAYLKVSIICGVIASLPFNFYQLWAFVSPGLYKKEKFVIFPLVISSTTLFIIGAAFCYYVILPISFDFLLSFSGDMIVNTITIGSYISFIGLLLLAFGFGFQLPIIAYVLGKMGIISSRFLSKGRRYSIIIILIVASIITPPDVFSQVMLAVPLYILYEISILIVRFTGKNH